jgi:hypothetical protein
MIPGARQVAIGTSFERDWQELSGFVSKTQVFDLAQLDRARWQSWLSARSFRDKHVLRR